MAIHSLYLENYRNYEKLYIEFSDSINFFIGKNASGKTNLLEAIGYFVLYRSFRGVPDIDLIRNLQNYFYLKLVIQDDIEKIINTYEVGIERNNGTRKKIKKNSKKITKISSLFNEIIGVFLTPDDVFLIESISERRNFFDFLFSQLDKDYLNSLIEYQKCLKQRNELLKRILERKSKIIELDFWDEKLIKNSLNIMIKRKKYIEEFKEFFYNRIKEISNYMDTLEIDINQEKEEDFKELFMKNRYNDIQSGTTTKGIHRDKFLFLNENKKDIISSFSQGQKRTVALSLKLAQYDILLNRFNIQPVLFIDDVIRELDQYRKKYFLDTLLNCGQVFFTTPTFEDDMKIFKEMKKNKCKIYEIEKGQIIHEF